MCDKEAMRASEISDALKELARKEEKPIREALLKELAKEGESTETES